jgi:hypothetical protein
MGMKAKIRPRPAARAELNVAAAIAFRIAVGVETGYLTLMTGSRKPLGAHFLCDVNH